MTVTAEDLVAALAGVVSALAPATTHDWSGVPGTGEHDCRTTAEHLGDCLISYAGQLVARPDGRYVRFAASADPDASPTELLEFVVAGGGILAAVLRGAAPDARAYHPTGVADPAGFAGMGCVEALVHGEDMARGLGLALDPPRDVCARVLDRMFPHVRTDVAAMDPWTGLLWATNRLDVPGHYPQTSWRWHAAPLKE